MVVVEGGGNHGQSLADPPNTCVNGYLDRYLGSGALPSGPDPVNATLPGPARSDAERLSTSKQPGGKEKPFLRHAAEPIRWERAAHQGMAIVVAAPAQ